jgi:2-hydroxychromene-2-carboxylate isomerase
MTSPSSTTSAETLTYFFDPTCPFTWMTSRWFVEAAGRAGIEPRWRAFSLTLINEGNEVPEEFQAGMRSSHRALRVIESLTAEGRHADAGAFYTEYGTRTFLEEEAPGDELIAAAGAAAGVPDALDRANNEANEALVRASFDEVRPLVGDDVGSPVIRKDTTGLAMFGPIVTPAPKGDAGDRLLTGVLALLDVPDVYEMKRTRTADIDFS